MFILIFIFAIIMSKLIQIGTVELCKKNEKNLSEFIIICIVLEISYILFYEKYRVGLEFFKYLSVITFMVFISLIDIKTKSVYFFTSASLFFMNLLFIVLGYLNGGEIKTYLYGGLTMAGVSSVLAFFKVFGCGDVEILTICGMFVGIYKSFSVLILSSALCGIYGIYKLLKNRSLKNDRVAFVPYITAALIMIIAY